MSIGKHSDTD